MWRNPKVLVTGVIASIVLAVSIIIINGMQMLSLVVRPFSYPHFRKFNAFLAKTYWSMCVYCAETVQGIEIIFTGDTVPRNENAIVIANHQGLTDVVFLLALGLRNGRLQDFKWFAKDILRYVPGIGWGLGFLDSIFLKRDWMKDQTSIEETFRNLKENKIPVWLISFLEGTRRTPAKLAASQAFATQRGLPILKHLLTPRTKGFVASVKGLRGHIHGIYDITIGYEETPSLTRMATGEVRRVHVHTRRFEISQLPTTDEGLTQWTLQLFQEKDQLLEEFYREGEFQKGAILASAEEQFAKKPERTRST